MNKVWQEVPRDSIFIDSAWVALPFAWDTVPLSLDADQLSISLTPHMYDTGFELSGPLEGDSVRGNWYALTFSASHPIGTFLLARRQRGERSRPN
jgi:hypothetical protein